MELSRAGTPWVVSAATAAPPAISLRPTSGPARGGTAVRINSTALFPADNATCTFAGTATAGSLAIASSVQPGNAAQLLKLLVLNCAAPVAAPAAAPLVVTLTSGTFSNEFETSFTYYDEQRVTQLESSGALSITPPWIDISGSDNITIRGDAIFALTDTPKIRLTAAAAPRPAPPVSTRRALLIAAGVVASGVGQHAPRMSVYTGRTLQAGTSHSSEIE